MHDARIIGVVLVLLLCGALEGYAQGSLIPPGAPGMTMKTLDQVEPRIPVDTGSWLIDQPGSYYLTGNFGVGVRITASDVSLDLMGYTLESGDGIQVDASVKNLVIRNGIIRADGYGIDFRNSGPDANTRIEDLLIEFCETAGIAVGSGCLIQRCQLRGVDEGTGIQVSGNSRVRDNQVTRFIVGLRATGTNALMENNRVYGNADNYDFSQGNHLNLLLCEIPEVLEWPCSVKLAGTLICTVTEENGISVVADHVTIDMAGHTLIGPGAGSGCGLHQTPGYRNLRISNGNVIGWRGDQQAGIYANGFASQIEGIRSTSNHHGIVVGEEGTIRASTASANVDDGFVVGTRSTVDECTGSLNGGRGIFADERSIITDSVFYGNGRQGVRTDNDCTIRRVSSIQNLSTGFDIDSDCVLEDSKALMNFQAWGISAKSRNVIIGCVVNQNAAGISASHDTRIYGCKVHHNNSQGIQVSTQSRVEDNQISGNGTGMVASDAGNFIARNTCAGNTVNWDIAAGNVCLVVQAATGGAFSGDSGGTAPGSTDPNANFTY